MSRDQRKLSKAIEERNILASTRRVSQISQTDNELKQKLEAINTSYKLSNKRIRNETRELREILHGLRKELKLSKETYGEYIPSLLEQNQGRPRRTTVSSVPSEDRKEAGIQKDQQGRAQEKDLKRDAIARWRSGSFPPTTGSHDVKKLKNLASVDRPDKFIQVKQGDVFEESEEPLTDVFVQEQTRELKNHQSFPYAQNKREFEGYESDEKRKDRRVSQKRDQTLRHGSSSTGQQQLGRKKSSTEDSQYFPGAFRGRFMTNDTSISTGSTRKTSRTRQIVEGYGETELHHQRMGIVEEYSSAPNQRKISVNATQYIRQRKVSNSNRGNSPITGFPGRVDAYDPEKTFDSSSENFGARRISVGHGRGRRISRATGLPPLKEELKTSQKLKEIPRENWSDLAKCRYLRKEEYELSIDDIFGKE